MITIKNYSELKTEQIALIRSNENPVRLAILNEELAKLNPPQPKNSKFVALTEDQVWKDRCAGYSFRA